MPHNRLLRWLAVAYFCRFSFAILALLTALPILGLVVAPSLLAGSFELQPRAIFWVSLLAFLTAYSVMNAWQVVRLYGDQRFAVTPPVRGAPQSPPALDLTWTHIVFFGACALPVVITVLCRSQIAQPDELRPEFDYPIGWTARYLYPVAAFALSLVILYLAQLLCDLFIPPESPAIQILFPKEPAFLREFHDLVRKANLFPHARRSVKHLLFRVPRQLGAGFINYESGTLLPGQTFAVALLALTSLVYAVIGWWHCGVALGHVLLLAMISCWLLSGLAFFFDRYRVPVAVPILGWMFLVHFSPKADHFYRTQPRKGFNPTAREVLSAPKAGDPVTPPPIIVVAANGGGIQSAAWTTRVLAGLEEASRHDPRLKDAPWRFGESVRMISSVSGGSVGALYFVASYDQNGRLPDDAALERLVRLSRRSSLDEVSHGLAYSDLGRLFFPMIGDKFADRADALEHTWSAGVPSFPSLSQWSEDVRKGTRPAVIFNTTGVESGERILFGTTDVDPGETGRRNFDLLVPPQDVCAVTGARLSATFPYVTPVAIADVAPFRSEASPSLFQHLADGGYYDNYGMATLMDWLNEALEMGHVQRPVLVIQIHGAPDAAASDASKDRGFFFQVFAPIKTMFSVRSSGQASHNISEFSLLGGKWNARRGYDKDDPFIHTITFTFGAPNPPLSWHLTHEQKGRIEREWQSETNQRECQAVMDFLAAGLQPPAPPPHPLLNTSP